MHSANPHQGSYDLLALAKTSPTLKPFIKSNPKGGLTINFADRKAVVALNQALLKHYYDVEHWAIPDGYLCPPIPGRADYIYHLADLLKSSTKDSSKIRVLDIGTGANIIYPILGSHRFGWHFVASDIDEIALKSAKLIVDTNKNLKGRIKVQKQKDKEKIFHGLIKPEDQFTLTLCNPPFHASLAEANQGSERKWRNLNSNASTNSKHASENTKGNPKRNFGGQNNELWCKGGEIAFLKKMANESKDFAQQVQWFSSLVSKKDNVRPLKLQLKKLGAKKVEVVKMAQGQKISRFVAWQF